MREREAEGKEKVKQGRAAGRCGMSPGCHSVNVTFVEKGKPTENTQQSAGEVTGQNRKPR